MARSTTGVTRQEGHDCQCMSDTTSSVGWCVLPRVLLGGMLEALGQQPLHCVSSTPLVSTAMLSMLLGVLFRKKKQLHVFCCGLIAAFAFGPTGACTLEWLTTGTCTSES